jgi:hypothetical protein
MRHKRQESQMEPERTEIKTPLKAVYFVVCTVLRRKDLRPLLFLIY